MSSLFLNSKHSLFSLSLKLKDSLFSLSFELEHSPKMQFEGFIFSHDKLKSSSTSFCVLLSHLSSSLKLKVVFSALLKIILAASGHDKDSPTSFKSKNSSVYLGNC